MEIGFYFLLVYFALWIVIAIFGVIVEMKDYYKHRGRPGF